MVSESEIELLDPTSPKHIEILDAGRVIIVGDIHGCCDELRQLLLQFRLPDDIIILAGDLVNKGPKSLEVLSLARELKAFGVVGNHELAVLRGHKLREGGARPDREPAYKWTDGLQDSDLEYIRRLPYTIRIPRHNAVVVHAGLVPGVPLTEQKPLDMVSMRNLVRLPGEEDISTGRARGPAYAACETDDEGVAWASLWPGPEHVYFGHDAKRRLQRYSFATGLDTGCVYGGALTAVILEGGKTPQLVSLPARTTYVEAGGRRGKPRKTSSRQQAALVFIGCTLGMYMMSAHGLRRFPTHGSLLSCSLGLVAGVCWIAAIKTITTGSA